LIKSLIASFIRVVFGVLGFSGYAAGEMLLASQTYEDVRTHDLKYPVSQLEKHDTRCGIYGPRIASDQRKIARDTI
jgi:hypothetical protein